MLATLALGALWALMLWSIAVCATVLWTMGVPWMPKWLQAVLRGRGTKLAPLPLQGAGSVLIVRPCAGADPSLLENLQGVPVLSEGTESARWSLRIRLAVSEISDGAYPIAVQAAKALVAQGHDAAVMVTHAEGPNHKCAQLSAVVEQCPGASVVLVADSDVALDAVDLRSVLAALGEGEAARWVAVREGGREGGVGGGGHTERSWGDDVSLGILSGSLHSFALLARIDNGCFVGKLFAIRADALSQMGGFAALIRHLGEDFELARRLQQIQLTAYAQVDVAASSTASGRTVMQVRDRFARWLLVLRKQRTRLLISYPLLFLAPWIQGILALVVLVVSAQDQSRLMAWVAIAFACVGRQLAFVAARRASDFAVFSARAWFGAMAGDAVLAWAWVHSFTLRTVRWRERELQFGDDGLLANIR